MFTLIKFCISFSISFLILAFPIKGKPVFYYLFKVAAPMTEGVYEGIRNGASASLKKGGEVGWGFFTNAVPPNSDKSSAKAKEMEVEVNEKHFEKDNKQLEALIKD